MFGYSDGSISKAIDRLVDNGFIEIAELGVGVQRKSHKIALTTNWQLYGTPGFKPGRGRGDPKGPINGGFKKKSTAETAEGTTAEIAEGNRPKARDSPLPTAESGDVGQYHNVRK